eukprot:scaffold689_cov333-Pavlova_lutheri.AAC.3
MGFGRVGGRPQFDVHPAHRSDRGRFRAHARLSIPCTHFPPSEGEPAPHHGRTCTVVCDGFGDHVYPMVPCPACPWVQGPDHDPWGNVHRTSWGRTLVAFDSALKTRPNKEGGEKPGVRPQPVTKRGSGRGGIDGVPADGRARRALATATAEVDGRRDGSRAGARPGAVHRGAVDVLRNDAQRKGGNGTRATGQSQAGKKEKPSQSQPERIQESVRARGQVRR